MDFRPICPCAPSVASWCWDSVGAASMSACTVRTPMASQCWGKIRCHACSSLSLQSRAEPFQSLQLPTTGSGASLAGVSAPGSLAGGQERTACVAGPARRYFKSRIHGNQEIQPMQLALPAYLRWRLPPRSAEVCSVRHRPRARR